MAVGEMRDQALELFGIDSFDALENDLEWNTDPVYPVTFERSDKKTREEPGTAYTSEKGEIRVEENLNVEVLRMNPETGDVRLEFNNGREDARRYKLLQNEEEASIFLAEIGYTCREVGQIMHRKEEETIQGRFSMNDNWMDYEGTREEGRLELIEAAFQYSEGDNINDLSLNTQKAITVYNRVKRRIEAFGKVKIRSDDHIGGTSGFHIRDDFKNAVRRVNQDSIDNYEIDEGNDYPIIISRKEH